jgi:transposase
MSTSTQALVGAERKRRRYRTTEEKRRIVEETLAPGVSVPTVARAHDVNANQVFHWRTLYRAGLLGNGVSDREQERSLQLLPVTVSTDSAHPTSDIISSTHEHPESRTLVAQPALELTFAKAQLRISGVDPSTLRLIIECLLA